MQTRNVAILKKELQKYGGSPKIILCIGSRQCVGDSLGPTVGELLISRYPLPHDIQVIGNMRESIGYKDINLVCQSIYHDYPRAYVIVVDAALAPREYVGEIVADNKKMLLGKAIRKEVYSVGNFGIRGLVAENKGNSRDNILMLYQVPQKRIATLSMKIANQIYQSICE